MASGLIPRRKSSSALNKKLFVSWGGLQFLSFKTDWSILWCVHCDVAYSRSVSHSRSASLDPKATLGRSSQASVQPVFVVTPRFCFELIACTDLYWPNPKWQSTRNLVGTCIMLHKFSIKTSIHHQMGMTNNGFGTPEVFHNPHFNIPDQFLHSVQFHPVTPHSGTPVVPHLPSRFDHFCNT